MTRAWLLAGLLLFPAARLGAAEDGVREAKQLYADGKHQFEEQHYDASLRLFERAYQLSARPALLFDIAACLSALDRPREAAARLRDYLERMPEDPQKKTIEDSIGELKARAAEQEAAVRAERAERNGHAASDPQRVALEERIRLLEERLSAPPRSRRRLAIGLGVSAGVLVVGVTALALGLGLHHSTGAYTPSSFTGGPLQSTR
jgi:tetratricopeptide (TPR) repeat protein